MSYNWRWNKPENHDNFIQGSMQSEIFAFIRGSIFRKSQSWKLENRLRHLRTFISCNTNLNLNVHTESLSVFVDEATRKRQTERVFTRAPGWGITLTFFRYDVWSSCPFDFFVFTQIIELVTFTVPRERYTISAANAWSKMQISSTSYIEFAWQSLK